MERNIIHAAHDRSNRTVSQGEVDHAGVVAVEGVPVFAVLGSVPGVVELGDLRSADPSVGTVSTGTSDGVCETAGDFAEHEGIGGTIGDVAVFGFRVVEEDSLELVVEGDSGLSEAAGATEVVGATEVRRIGFGVTDAQQGSVVEGCQDDTRSIAGGDVRVRIIAWAEERGDSELCFVPACWSVPPENVAKFLSRRAHRVRIRICGDLAFDFPLAVELIDFQVWEKEDQVTDVGPAVELDACKTTAPSDVVGPYVSWWIAFDAGLEVVRCQSQLFEIVLALHPASCFAGSLDCWQEQSYEDANDRDDDQEFNEREPFLVLNHTLGHSKNPQIKK